MRCGAVFDERAFAAHFNEHEPIGELNNNDAGGSYVKLTEEFHQRNRPSLLLSYVFGAMGSDTILVARPSRQRAPKVLFVCMRHCDEGTATENKWVNLTNHEPNFGKYPQHKHH